MPNLLDDLIEASGNEYIQIIDNGYREKHYLDTGSYLLNAQQSTSIFGGIPNNQITFFAGEKATGKTYLLLKIVKLYLEKHPDAQVIYFETEWAIHPEEFEERGVDMSRCRILRVKTVQRLNQQINSVLKKYNKIPKEQKFPLLICVDSVGMLTTNKAVEDLDKGDDKVDMGKAKLLMTFFRTLALDLGAAGVSMICTNHTYKDMNSAIPKYAKTIMGGGSGIQYSCSSTIFLTRSKAKEGEEVVGNIIHSYAEKCRSAKEFTTVELKLHHKLGLNRYYGLLDLACEAGIIKKCDTKYKMPNGKFYLGSAIYKNPKKFFTQELLEQIDAFAKEHFKYGQSEEVEAQD